VWTIGQSFPRLLALFCHFAGDEAVTGAEQFGDD
jgi:hypothetical protein